MRSHVHRYGHRWTAVMLDVDHFRRYNEALGHDAGDDVLRRVAKAIRKTLRDGDIAYRYGGEQFLVLLPEQDEDGGVVVAQRCRAAVAALAIVHPRSDASDRVTLSAGVAELHGDQADAVTDWLRRADLALYAAKAQGRDGIVRGESTHLAGPDVGA
jgi:diguanylate cyclase (GGDEF)-like protein